MPACVKVFKTSVLKLAPRYFVPRAPLCANQATAIFIPDIGMQISYCMLMNLHQQSKGLGAKAFLLHIVAINGLFGLKEGFVIHDMHPFKLLP